MAPIAAVDGEKHAVDTPKPLVDCQERNGHERVAAQEVSFQQPTQPTQQANDALDQFMQREPQAAAQGAPTGDTSNLQALCLAKRRAVLLEMGVDESELHPSLRGYAAPRRQLDFTAVDALDTFMGGA